MCFPSVPDPPPHQGSLTLYLHRGRTFQQYEDFKKVLAARRKLFGEKWWCTDGETVKNANLKFYWDKANTFKESFKYVRCQHKCTHPGCEAEVLLRACRERDVLEVVHCKLGHSHDLLTPDEDQVKRTEEELNADQHAAYF